MIKLGLRARLFASALASALVAATLQAAADDVATGTHEAGIHFDRGVALYGETDYPAALVEFKRAYAIAPNVAVLYNIGEAQYQLQDYASALVTFTHYLADAPSGSGHRVEVENDVEVLRSRVGHLTVVTVPPGADVSVDDQPAGKTPLDDRLLVSVGHRKITAASPGRAPATRFVDVAADDNVSVTLELPAIAPVAGSSLAPDRTRSGEASSPSKTGSTWRVIGWVATGALAVGAAGTGILAFKESAGLKASRNTFPVSPAALQAESNRTRTYSIVSDSLTVAAALVGGITLLSTVTSHGAARGAEGTAALRLAPASADFEVTF